MSESDEDVLIVDGADLDTGGDNLVWRAIQALREATGAAVPVSVHLLKRLPVAAGIGGGSADAAAALVLYHDMLSGVDVDLPAIGAGVGSDVPMCLTGGRQLMTGYGEELTSLGIQADDHWMVCAVPPFELSTPAVYRAWDVLGEPRGPEVAGRAVPPSLRDLGPLRNDLLPAARAVAPDLGDWIETLSDLWDRPVLLSGSGPTLFAFFSDRDEADEAAQVVPREARAVKAVRPTATGVDRDER